MFTNSLKSSLNGSELNASFSSLLLCRHLSGEIAQEWMTVTEDNVIYKKQLTDLAEQIVPYHMQHNAEAEACDLVMEIERLDLLDQYVDEDAFPRVALYLTRYTYI